MQHRILQLRQSLNEAHLRLKTSRSDMELFEQALRALLESLRPNETGQQARNHVRDFLKSVLYVNYSVNTLGSTNLVIHTGLTANTSAGVLLVVVQPGNKADMPISGNLDCKAMHELLLCYLQERVQHYNHDLRHLVITDAYEWFIFDALDLDRLFYRNTQLKNDFMDWSEGRGASRSTDFFHKEIASPAVASLKDQISSIRFDLRDFGKMESGQSTEDLEALFKVLAPAHLLNKANSSEQLDDNSSPVCYAHLNGLRDEFKEQE